jgi:hypothetical protein
MAHLRIVDSASPEARYLECEQCGEDYALIERMCVVVAIEDVYLGEKCITGQTICGNCVSRLGITGWRFERWSRYDGGLVADPLGTSPPPLDSTYPLATYRQILEALAERPFPVPTRGATEHEYLSLLRSF